MSMLDRLSGSEVVRRRRVWCPIYRREVEVEFAERGLPGFRDAVAVQTCSAFEDPTRPTCERVCLDPARRRLPPMARWSDLPGPPR